MQYQSLDLQVLIIHQSLGHEVGRSFSQFLQLQTTIHHCGQQGRKQQQPTDHEAGQPELHGMLRQRSYIHKPRISFQGIPNSSDKRINIMYYQKEPNINCCPPPPPHQNKSSFKFPKFITLIITQMSTQSNLWSNYYGVDYMTLGSKFYSIQGVLSPKSSSNSSQLHKDCLTLLQDRID